MNDKVCLYSDGASRGNGKETSIGAWAVVIHYDSKKDSMSMAVPNITNNQAELTAILMGLKELQKLGFENKPIEIFSDSAYCVNGINDWVHGWVRNGWINSKKKPVENKELWKEIYEIRRDFKNLSFTKVKGHSDNKGNIEADLLCNKAMDNYIKGLKSTDNQIEVVELNLTEEEI